MSSGNKVFGKRIKELREGKGYTQEKLAELVGLDYQTISRIETGYYFTSYENLEKLSTALGVEIKDLFSIQHLENPEGLMLKITELLKTAKPEDIKLFYKIILSILR